MYVSKTKEEGPGGVRGGEGQKREDFFVDMRGIGWGPPQD